MILGGFDMEDYAISPRRDIGVYPLLRLFNHEMHVELLFGDFVNGRRDVWAERQVRNKVTIHDVHVNPVSIVNGTYLITQL